PVIDLASARAVLLGYCQRWRVEEFHRAWKSECQVERSQTRDILPVQRWATLLAAMAVRIERLKVLARTQPEAPASVEFQQEEIDALILLRDPDGFDLGAQPTIAQALRWVADIGG